MMDDISNSTASATSLAASEPMSEASSGAGGSSPQITFQGNSYDLMSVVGVTVGGMTLLTCATCNMGFYCLPLVPIILGGLGLALAKDSVDPDRTRLLSWLSVGAGAIILVLIVLFIALYFGLIIFAIAAENSGGF